MKVKDLAKSLGWPYSNHKLVDDLATNSNRLLKKVDKYIGEFETGLTSEDALTSRAFYSDEKCPCCGGDHWVKCYLGSMSPDLFDDLENPELHYCPPLVDTEAGEATLDHDHGEADVCLDCFTTLTYFVKDDDG